MAVIRHIALNLVKSEKTAKVGVKNKRLKAGWDEDYLLKVVLGRAVNKHENITSRLKRNF
jgi:hypothetical protein